MILSGNGNGGKSAENRLKKREEALGYALRGFCFWEKEMFFVGIGEKNAGKAADFSEALRGKPLQRGFCAVIMEQ